MITPLINVLSRIWLAIISIVTIHDPSCVARGWLGRRATLGGMETRWPVAGQAGSPMASDPVAAQAIGGMEGPMAPISARRSAAWKGHGPSRRRPADEWNEMARPRRHLRRRGTKGDCHRQWNRNNVLQSSGGWVQRCGWFFPSPPIEQGRYPIENPTANGALLLIASKAQSPILCPTGVIFADAIRHAISLGRNEDCFWVVSLNSAFDPKLWIQFTDYCMNVTDSLPQMAAEYPSLPPYIIKVDRCFGSYTVLSYCSPPPIEFLAATACQYLHSRFPKPLAFRKWNRRIYESPLPRRLTDTDNKAMNPSGNGGWVLE